MKKWLLSCEHGGNRIPVEYSSAFEGQAALLNSHRGFDNGVESLFTKLEKSGLFNFSIINLYSRLLLDFNRSLGSRNLFSDISGHFSEAIKKELINNYYLPFRNQVEEIILKWLNNGFDVIHISLHSFTPVLKGVQRNCDFAVLYDPGCSEEKELAQLFRKQIGNLIPWWKVRFNYPYKGISDGHVEACRRNLPKVGPLYTGIELELNQELFAARTHWEDHFLAVLKDVRGGF